MDIETGDPGLDRLFRSASAVNAEGSMNFADMMSNIVCDKSGKQDFTLNLLEAMLNQNVAARLGTDVFALITLLAIKSQYLPVGRPFRSNHKVLCDLLGLGRENPRRLRNAILAAEQDGWITAIPAPVGTQTGTEYRLSIPGVDDEKRQRMEAESRRRPETTADLVALNGWSVGDVLESDSGEGVDRIRITAIGESSIFAKQITKHGKPFAGNEIIWTLLFRKWTLASSK